MSASSGITVSQDLASTFADAIQKQSVRFIKVLILNESLVHDASISSSGSLEEDFIKLLDVNFLSDDIPAYILVKLHTPQDWLFINYVPDAAKVREKVMLYASTRASFLKSLGSSQFTDTIFATSKADLTWDAYLAHLKHNSAPNPLSAREQEISNLRAAEANTATYEGSRARVNHVGTGVGLSWSPDVEAAVHELKHGTGESVLVATIDPQTETIILHSQSQLDSLPLAEFVPKSDPSFIFFARDFQSESGQTRQIVFIYSCPSTSPVKHRMLYSSTSGPTYNSLKTSLADEPSISLAPKRIETSDPSELTKEFLESEFNLTSNVAPAPTQQKAFAKPKGPPRRR
ncbi:actin depolymerizing protein [Panaeolus papilionaceus]|nr:actin depolymerizing protein [Panaeolus papilionaceus]